MRIESLSVMGFSSTNQSLDDISTGLYNSAEASDLFRMSTRDSEWLGLLGGTAPHSELITSYDPMATKHGN